MAKLKGPLLSLLASGKLTTGLQLATRPRGTTLTRPHKPHTTYSRSQLSLRSFTAMLTRFWAEWHQAIGLTWADHPRANYSSPYHAMLFENHLRRKRNLWPIAVWNIPPSGSPPLGGAKLFEGKARTITLRMLVMSGNKAIFAAGFTLPFTYGIVKPLNVCEWSSDPPYAFRTHMIRHLAPGTYAAQWHFIDGFGQLSALVYGAGIQVQP